MRASAFVLAASGACALLAVTFAGPARAQDAMAGRKLAQGVCGGCHGVDGIAVNPEAANLAGQDAGYLSRQILAFKTGTRQNENMNLVAKDLTDEQIANIAAYYAAIQVQVVKVPGAE